MPDASTLAPARAAARAEVESPQAWLRLAVCLLVATIGGVGMWSVVVALPAVQADFHVARASASLPYVLTMLGFGAAGIAMGRLSDRYGILVPIALGAVLLGAGYLGAALAPTLGGYGLAQALIGAGSSATFAPLLAHTSLWFTRRRGIAVAIIASGNYLAGTVWPTIVEHFIGSVGWRSTHAGIGVFCLATMLPLALTLRTPAPAADPVDPARGVAAPPLPELSPRALQALLCVAGLACCIAMSMPQVHLVAYCSDLGYGPARGAQMLSLMLACGIVSRLAFGVICDRIGGLRTLLLGSALQGIALTLFLPFDGLVSLYVISALFGLFQGGIVPSYAIIVREYFARAQAGARVAVVITATLGGMALGGYLSGVIFDLTGSYRAAFLHGIAWNLVNVAIVTWLLRRSLGRFALAA
jgi:MFS family permease